MINFFKAKHDTCLKSGLAISAEIPMTDENNEFLSVDYSTTDILISRIIEKIVAV